MSNDSSKKVNSFQVLRGIAILLVVLCHFSKFTNFSGQIGVSIFMIMGGFFAMLSTSKKDKFEKKYFVNKIIKIYPLYFVITTLTFLVSMKFPGLLNNNVTFLDFIKSLFFIPYHTNNALIPVVGSTWYLGIDIAFTILFFFSSKFSFKKRDYVCSILIIFLLLLGLVTDNEFIIYYFKLPCLYYIIGFIFWKIYNSQKKNTKFVAGGAWPFVFQSLMICILFFLSFYYEYNFFYMSLLTIIILVYLILSSTVNDKKYSRLLLEIGNISFSIYLTHEWIIKPFERLFYSISFNNILGIVSFLLLLLVCYFVAKVCNIIFEKKLFNYIKNKMGM